MAPLAFSVSSTFTTHKTVLPLKCSSFSGRTVLSPPPITSKAVHPSSIQMKKGRFRPPAQQSRQRQQQQQMKLPEDGTPVFALFVRTSKAKLWYPLGAVQGDERSKGLVNAMKGKFLSGMYENTLDKGMAQTVFGKDNQRFVQNAIRMYPQLKKYVRELEFGYRVAAVGLDEQPTKPLSKEMALPFFDWAKRKLSGELDKDKKQK